MLKQSVVLTTAYVLKYIYEIWTVKFLEKHGKISADNVKFLEVERILCRITGHRIVCRTREENSGFDGLHTQSSCRNAEPQVKLIL
jgi:hypothetical protein